MRKHDDRLEKFQCCECDEQFLLNISREKKHIESGNYITCPYCRSADVESVAWSGERELDLGCLGIYDYELEG
jgi:DNA-directed RNA polymerase subunit RPC12/RpoP